MVNWERLYDQSDFNEPVTVLHETIFKRLWINYVLNKYIPVNDSDTVLLNEIFKTIYYYKKFQIIQPLLIDKKFSLRLQKNFEYNFC